MHNVIQVIECKSTSLFWAEIDEYEDEEDLYVQVGHAVIKFMKHIAQASKRDKIAPCVHLQFLQMSDEDFDVLSKKTQGTQAENELRELIRDVECGNSS